MKDVSIFFLSIASICFVLQVWLLGRIYMRLEKLKLVLAEMDKEYERVREIENSEGGQIADSSPRHLQAKKAERIRKGEDDDEQESQIVGTRTNRQRREEEDKAKEARLDKWMPGVKHD